MREILFTGKRLDNGEWIDGHLLRYNGEKARIVVVDEIIFCDEDNISVIQTVARPVDPSTVGQYTGLCDKNGKRIFEGDILATRSGIPHIVKFEDGGFALTDTAIPIRHANVFEIIGNCHDNPELLEVSHE